MEEIGVGIKFDKFTEQEFQEIHRALKDSFSAAEIYVDDTNTIRAEFWDCIELIEITVKKRVNQYGASEFSAKVYYINFSETIPNCYNCDECIGEPCILYGKTSQEIDKYIEKEIAEYTKTRIHVRFMNTEIHAKPIVVEKYDTLAKSCKVVIKTTNFSDLVHTLGLLHIILELPFSVFIGD